MKLIEIPQRIGVPMVGANLAPPQGLRQKPWRSADVPLCGTAQCSVSGTPGVSSLTG